MLMNKVTLLLLIGILFSCDLKREKEKTSSFESPTFSDSLTNKLNKIYKQGHIMGFSVSIVNQDKTLYQKGFGFSDTRFKKSYTENTIQNIASISKTLLGISLLKAQELGKLHLNDPINKYLPFEVKNPYHPNLPITINHLATHTSTIIDTEYYNNSYLFKTDSDQLSTYPTLSEYLTDILTKNGKFYKKEGFLNNMPGSLYKYTNIGAALAAIVLEKATGEKYYDFTEKYILKPCKMKDSGWSINMPDLSNHSILYNAKGIEYPSYKLITYPDGGFITSANDLSFYLTELIRGYSGGGGLLSVKSYKTLFNQQLGEDNFSLRSTTDYSIEYNTGIFIGFTPNGLIGHTGGDPGVSAFMFFNPKTKIGRILIANTDLGEDGWQEFIDVWNILDKYSAQLQ
ncbi:MAG: serine hydrolase domain-containing protein [Winogradskyella sp.]